MSLSKISICYHAQIPDFSMYKTKPAIGSAATQQHKKHYYMTCLKAHGKPVKLQGYFDASHARCLKNMTLSDRHPTFHQQLSYPLVQQIPEPC